MSAPTLSAAIEALGTHRADAGFTFQDVRGNETTLRFPELKAEVARRAAGLQALGLHKGDRIGIIVVEPEDFILSFLGAVRVGIVPIPLYPPLSFGSLDAYAERTAGILANGEARLLVASKSLQNVLWGLVDRVPSLERLVAADAVAVDGIVPELPSILPEDLAFLQYTSGSTADPKGVVVTHRNLAANCHSMREALDVLPHRDVAVSWLPLYHDMGLIGCVITPVFYEIPSVYIPTVRFVKKPTAWFEAIHHHKGTQTFAPNFAYALMVKKAKPEDLERWDLSPMRAFGCGAEPIHPSTFREFAQVFAQCGVRPEQFLPAYGLAEATLAVAFKSMGSVAGTQVVDAERFQESGTVVPAIDGCASFEHVSCGSALPGVELAIFSEEGERLEAGREGEICVRGEAVTSGYYRNAAATEATMRNDWLRTGDLGYLLDDQLYVTGRIKDLIILNGRNVHPQAVEWACATVDGVRKGNVVAFSRPGADSEELIVALEARESASEALPEEVKRAVQASLGLTLVDIVVLEPGTLPKTSSGKLQRRKTRDLYLTGQLGAQGSRLPGATADRLTLARHVASSMWSRAKAAVLSK